MNKKLLFLSIGIVFLLAVAIIAATGDKREVGKAELPPGNLQMETPRAACQMYKFNPGLTSIVYLTGYVSGDVAVTYFDPTDATTNGCGVAAAYPFQINSLSFMLWDYAGAVWPVTVNVVVFDMAVSGDPCSGPGNVICSETYTCYQASFDGVLGTVAFTNPCCVNEPFFIGVQYNDPSGGPFPAYVTDATYSPPAIAQCEQWDIWQGNPWTEWYAGWGNPPPDYLLYAVNGETVSGNCLWPDHKMHFPQLPDEAGWDVHVGYPMFLSDDWTCSETGPVKDIHFWGSWLDGTVGTIDQFVIKIWSDQPADPPSIPYSHPFEELWTYLAPPSAFEATPLDPSGTDIYEGWYDPSVPESNYPNHQQYWRYDVILPEQAWFDQTQGTTYWLSIECLLVDDGTGAQWGWKNTQNHYLDDACYWDGQQWIEIYEPGEELSNFFEIQIDAAGNYAGGYGVGSYIDPTAPVPGTKGWYLYEATGVPWWNIWFVDHPLDYTRIKDIRIDYSVRLFDDLNPEMYAQVTPNWATDLWTLEGMPPTEPRPPLPGDFATGTPPESDWIGRGNPPDIWQGPIAAASYILRIPDYNPEWVSVDVNGFNIWVEGTIYHTCRASLDLAFVITGGEASGACCYPDPTGSGDLLCVVTTPTDCGQTYFGTYQGDGTSCGGSMEACCLPNGSCVMADVFCCTNDLGGTPQGVGSQCTALEACCFTDNSCQDLDPLCCIALGGTPQGAGTDCATVDCNPEPTGACCWTDPPSPDLFCDVVTRTYCEQTLGGTYQGDGTICNGSFEACCLPDGSCIMADVLCCTSISGAPQGAGSTCTSPSACCLPDGRCEMLDPLCCADLGGTPQAGAAPCSAPEACCMSDGSCRMLDPLCCVDLGGTPQGAQTSCTAVEACCFTDGSCQDLDPLCCVDLGGTPQGAGTDCASVDCNPEPTGACCWIDPPSPDLYCTVATRTWCDGLGGTYHGDGTTCGGSMEACCLPDGSCIMADVLCCTSISGTPQGPGTDCATVTCEIIPETPKNFYQPPDLTTKGMDVHATYPLEVLAEDFLCTETAPITEIHIWGSWLNDIYPGADPPTIEGDPGNVTFHVSVHSDIVAGQLAPWSMPGGMLADWTFGPTEFIYKPVRLTESFEGWFEPFTGAFIAEGDHNCYEYIFQFDESNWFVQQGSDLDPVIYWVDIQATVEGGGAFFGWKSSVDHGNDDAVWWEGIDTPEFNPWYEMRYPAAHPYADQSVDLSLLIGGPCDCVPGETDQKPVGAPEINILDIVYMINYKYKGGPAPIPYELCNGDANCNCVVDILDIVYVINYKYKGGPPPCTCANFLANCPGGLR